MENNPKSAQRLIIGAQLQKARELLQFTIAEVAHAVGVSPEDIKNWEEEKDKPNLKRLEILANLYGREIDYFLRETPEPPAGIEFRGKPAQSLKALSNDARIMLARFDELCRMALEIEELLGQRQEVKISTFKISKNPKIDAHNLRERYELEDRPICQLRDLLVKDGVRIFELPIPNDELSGFSFWHLIYGPCILINAKDLLGRKTFTLAHELAHILYSDGSSLCYIPVKFNRTQGRIEYKANQFAVELLLPESGVKKDFEKRHISNAPSEKELSQMSSKWCVSVQALGYRLENLNLVTKGHTNALLIPKPSHFRRPKTPAWEKQLGKRFVDMSVEAYKRNLISVSKLAHTLQIPIRKAIEIVEYQGK